LSRGGFGVRQILGILTGLQVLYAIIGLLGHFAGVPEYLMFAAWAILGLTHLLIIRNIAKVNRVYRWSKIRSGHVAGQNETVRTQH